MLNTYNLVNVRYSGALFHQFFDFSRSPISQTVDFPNFSGDYSKRLFSPPLAKILEKFEKQYFQPISCLLGGTPVFSIFGRAS